MLQILLTILQQPDSTYNNIVASEPIKNRILQHPFEPSFVLVGLLIVLVIVIQAFLFFITCIRISRFKRVLPKVSMFSIDRVLIYNDVLKQTDPHTLLQNLSNLKVDPAQIDISKTYTELTLLRATNPSEPLKRIGESINTYLIRNKGALADFNLLRDIIQRNLDTLEEEISITLPLPLYVGLLGTMLGIVIGLFNMPTLEINNFASGEGTSNLGGVNVLIDGVKYAMLASFAGLLATVLNSWFYRGAKLTLEHHKHDLFTFLQTELLPILTESVNAGIYDLNRSLSQFGTKFIQVADKLDKTVTRNYDALMAQQELLNTIQSIDLSRIATFNVKVMEELRKSTSSLERFATFLSTLTTLTDNTRQLVERTNDVESLSSQLIKLLSESQRLQRFLMSHFEQLEQRGQVINTAVVKLDEVVDKSLNELQQHIVERLAAVRKITIHEDDLLLQAFERNRDVLKNLTYLGPLEKGVESISRQGEQIQQENQPLFVAMLNTLQQINQKLDRQDQPIQSVSSRIFSWLRKRQNKVTKFNIKDRPLSNSDIIPDRFSSQQTLDNKSFDHDLKESSKQDILLVNQQSMINKSVFYFPPPEPWGGFDDDKRMTQPASDTYYKFILADDDANVARFGFELNSENIAHLLIFRNHYIDPVCESQNQFQSKLHTRIVLLVEGTARLTSSQWHVETKALIKYI